MPGFKRLPPDFTWRADVDQHALYAGDTPLVRIEPVGNGWVASTAFHAPGLAYQRYAVRSIQSGKGWAERWVRERQQLIARTLGRPELSQRQATHSERRRDASAA